MGIAQELDCQESISQDVIFPPGDLYSDEPPLETELHLRQIILLLSCLEWLWKDRRAQQETQKAERLAAKLRELNIDPDRI